MNGIEITIRALSMMTAAVLVGAAFSSAMRSSGLRFALDVTLVICGLIVMAGSIFIPSPIVHAMGTNTNFQQQLDVNWWVVSSGIALFIGGSVVALLSKHNSIKFWAKILLLIGLILIMIGIAPVWVRHFDGAWLPMLSIPIVAQNLSGQVGVKGDDDITGNGSHYHFFIGNEVFLETPDENPATKNRLAAFFATSLGQIKKVLRKRGYSQRDIESLIKQIKNSIGGL